VKKLLSNYHLSRITQPVALAGVLLLLFALAGCGGNGSAERICKEFMELKNANDARANELLAAAPAIPTEPVSEEEADRLDAEFMLRSPFRIKEVRPVKASDDPGPAQFILVAQGTFDAEPFRVRTPTGVEPHQRHLFNPDIYVKVENGKIHGVRVTLHRGP
jgi:hypothetical protein